ncbi:hypothetical protein LEP1GSC073_3510 [Leptospira noguchii str. Cascata]|nr:hypothetical protein LEP1GSC073_3510 [Leptospira noguchii str. Cascata]
MILNLNTFLVDCYVFKNITKNLNISASGRKYYPNYILGRVPDLVPIILSDPNTTAVMEGDRMVRRQLGYFSEMKLDYKGNVLSLGARRDYYDLSREWKTSPRLMFAKEIDSTKTTFFGGTGKFFQAPPDVSYISKKIGNPNLKMEESQHSNRTKVLSSYSVIQKYV